MVKALLLAIEGRQLFKFKLTEDWNPRMTWVTVEPAGHPEPLTLIFVLKKVKRAVSWSVNRYETNYETYMSNPAGAAAASCAIDSAGAIKTKAARRFKNLDIVFNGWSNGVEILLKKNGEARLVYILRIRALLKGMDEIGALHVVKCADSEKESWVNYPPFLT